MKFSIQLSADYPDKSYGADKVYADMLNQAILADELGFDAVSITEHHLINCLMMPAPLLFAVQIAAHTKHINIMTSVIVLPLHDMRILAGEVVAADIFTDGRLMLGVGRGAFAYEMERLGVPMSETRPRFEESLEVLSALLSKEDVAWSGEYYNFDPITIMPRPVRPINLMMAVMNPAGIHASTKRGMHIQTTPLAGNHDLLVDQVGAFTRAKQELAGDGDHLTISLSRLTFLTQAEPDRQAKLETAHSYYGRFDNVFTGPGIVDRGMIRQLPREQSIDELDKSILICGAEEMIDQLGVYSDLGIDRFIMGFNFGANPDETIESIQAFAEQVMPHFADPSSGPNETSTRT